MSARPIPRKAGLSAAEKPGVVGRPAGMPAKAGAIGGRKPGSRRPNASLPPAEALPEPPSRAPEKKPRPRGRGGEERYRLVEAIFFHLYDIGLSVDLKKVAAIIPAHDDFDFVKRRDTPASLQLPRPLVLKLDEGECLDAGDFECVSVQGKVYDDAAITVMVRVKIRIKIRELHTIRQRTINTGGRRLSIAEYAEESFDRLLEAIRPATIGMPAGGMFDRETYAAYCLIDGEEWPSDLIERERHYLAALLSGEEPGAPLHESQLAATLGKPFSYRKSDLAIFDMDRCLIVDPDRDYEDLLLIIEHANYQLLELRALDKLLDRRLDEAERDMRAMYSGDRRKRHRLGTSIQEKFANIQSLRFDALFILENLENSSKIIGDYYLGQIYDRLCGIFNTEGWKWSVERRLDTLESIYDMVKTDLNDKKILVLEIVFIVVCIVFPLIQILQVMLLS